jgi:autonomous glycyl radical cofactor GrcA
MDGLSRVVGIVAFFLFAKSTGLRKEQKFTAVAREYRGRGYATLLLAAADERAVQLARGRSVSFECTAKHPAVAAALRKLQYTKADKADLGNYFKQIDRELTAAQQVPYVDKQTNEEEAIALQRLTQIAATRVPVLLSPAVRRGKGYKVRMTNKGTTLDAMGGRRTVGGKEIVIQRGKQLEGDLRVALTEIWNAGIRHLDLPMRGQTNPKNITWDGANFNIIDFDTVEFSSNWSVEDELQEVLSAISVWANSRDDYGWLPGAKR